MAVETPTKVAEKALGILSRDRHDYLDRVDDYVQGRHDSPYMPDMADEEYKLLAERAITNWMPLITGTVAQACYVDGYRSGQVEGADGLKVNSTKTPQWDFWQRSRFDARQATVYRGALNYGHYFVAVQPDPRNPGKAIGKVLSALNTVALFEDPQNDEDPTVVVTIDKRPVAGDESSRGKGRMWDDEFEYAISWSRGHEGMRVRRIGRHGFNECPVTRFAPWVDGEGRTVGAVWPLIPVQNRINQTIFDLLVAQTYGSFQVRTVTGMVPDIKTRPVYEKDEQGNYVLDEHGNRIIEDYEPVIDPHTGKPVPERIHYNARRFLFAEDHQAKFDSLPPTPLDGYIESADKAVRDMAAIAQVPPHHLLGQVANLSADALAAAESSLMRKADEIKSSFGESWERVFRLAMAYENAEGADDYHGEVIWRDVGAHSLSQTADALGKIREQLEVPPEGLWPLIPGISQGMIDRWSAAREEAMADRQMVENLFPASRTRSQATEAPPAA